MRAVGSWLVNKHGQHVYSAECKKKKEDIPPKGVAIGRRRWANGNADKPGLWSPNTTQRIESNRNESKLNQ